MCVSIDMRITTSTITLWVLLILFYLYYSTTSTISICIGITIGSCHPRRVELGDVEKEGNRIFTTRGQLQLALREHGHIPLAHLHTRIADLCGERVDAIHGARKIPPRGAVLLLQWARSVATETQRAEADFVAGGRSPLNFVRAWKPTPFNFTVFGKHSLNVNAKPATLRAPRTRSESTNAVF